MTLALTETENHVDLKIRLAPNCVGIHPLGHEAAVVVHDGENCYSAWVPAHALGENNRYLPVQRVGRIGNLALIALPVGNDGATTWRIPEDRLAGLLFE